MAAAWPPANGKHRILLSYPKNAWSFPCRYFVDAQQSMTHATTACASDGPGWRDVGKVGMPPIAAAERRRVGVPPAADCREFVGLESWEATIGRRPPNHVGLPNTSVSPRHWRITTSREPFICDLEGAVVRGQSLLFFPESVPEGLVRSFGRTPNCVQTIPRLVPKPQRKAEC